MVKHHEHAVKTDQNYHIKECDKTIIVLSGGNTNPIHLSLPQHPDIGQEITILAIDIDVVVDMTALLEIPQGTKAELTFIGVSSEVLFEEWFLTFNPLVAKESRRTAGQQDRSVG